MQDRPGHSTIDEIPCSTFKKGDSLKRIPILLFQLIYHQKHPTNILGGLIPDEVEGAIEDPEGLRGGAYGS